MTDCRQTQLEMIGSAMSLEALRHLENCAACRARLCAELSLSAALGATPSYDVLSWRRPCGLKAATGDGCCSPRRCC